MIPQGGGMAKKWNVINPRKNTCKAIKQNNCWYGNCSIWGNSAYGLIVISEDTRSILEIRCDCIIRDSVDDFILFLFRPGAYKLGHVFEFTCIRTEIVFCLKYV